MQPLIDRAVARIRSRRRPRDADDSEQAQSPSSGRADVEGVGIMVKVLLRALLRRVVLLRAVPIPIQEPLWSTTAQQTIVTREVKSLGQPPKTPSKLPGATKQGSGEQQGMHLNLHQQPRSRRFPRNLVRSHLQNRPSLLHLPLRPRNSMMTKLPRELSLRKKRCSNWNGSLLRL